MANYSTLISGIQNAVYENHNNEINAVELQTALISMINELGSGYQYMGVAIPTTNPGTPDEKVFYFATQNGTYANFDGISITEDEVAILCYDTAWHKVLTGIASNEKLHEFNDLLSASIGDAIKITDIIAGSYISNNGKSITLDSARAYCERYIRVESGKTYVINKKGYIPCIIFYDESYNTLSSKWFTEFETTNSFTPNADGYIRISLWSNDKTTPFDIEDYNPVEIICYDSVIYNQKNINEKIYDVTGGICVIDERDIDMNVYITAIGSRSRDIARCHSSFIPVLGGYSYELNNGGYKILLSYFDKDKRFISWEYWFAVGVDHFETPINCSYVIVNFATIDASVLTSFSGASIVKKGEIKEIKQDINILKDKASGIGRAFIKSGFYIYHNFVGSIEGIPSQSLKDIAFAAKTNADIIEANIHKCSDGVYVCRHGVNGALGTGLNFGNSGYTSSTLFSNASSTILRQQVTYAGNDPQNSSMHIPTLDEFCMECRRHNIAVSLSTSDSSFIQDSLSIARKYLSDDKIAIGLYGNSFVRGDFKGLVADYYDFSNKEGIVARAKSIGLPYLYCWKNYDSMDKETIKEAVEYLHKNGVLVSGAYDTPTSIIERQNEGFDAVSPTTVAIKPFDYGGLMDFFDTSADIIYEGGATYSSLSNETTMPAGSRLIVYKSAYNNYYMGGSLKIRYKGKLTIYSSLGTHAPSPSFYYALKSFESNGDTYITFAQTNTYGSGGNMLIILAEEDTTIYSMEFHAKRLM